MSRKYGFGLVKRSGRYCAASRCHTELIKRPTESDEQFAQRRLCGACEQKRAQPNPLLRPIAITKRHRDVLPPEQVHQFAKYAGGKP